jgi:C-terminal processing protease CtpA/Prc
VVDRTAGQYAARQNRSAVPSIAGWRILRRGGTVGVYFSQPLPVLPAGKTLYTGATVMLIDDRAISQAEHSGLFFEAANGTRFIGTATAGANGDVARFSAPGGLWIGFTGHDVRHADGRQLQRVGLVPDVEAAPTRAGLRAGKDEVLEAAMRYLQEAAVKASGMVHPIGKGGSVHGNGRTLSGVTRRTCAGVEPRG